MEENGGFDAGPGGTDLGASSSGSSLVFVYNADSGFLSQIADFMHKMTSPETYPCKLCGLTYGTFGMKTDWQDFVSKLETEVEFLHRDQFLRQYDLRDAKFPSVYLRRGSTVRLLIGSDEIDSCQSLDDLKSLVTRKAEDLGNDR